MSKIIDYFYINEKSACGKDYAATEYKIELPYRLRIGDKINRVCYPYASSNMTILDITEEGMKVTDKYDETGSMFIPWFFRDKPIQITPFPYFIEGINKKTFKKIITKSPDDFAMYEYVLNWNLRKFEKIDYTKQRIKDIMPYIKNFNNIDPVEEIIVKLEDTKKGQYRFAI